MNFNLLAGNASQNASNSSSGGSVLLIVYIVIIVAAMYFFMIRPNKKKQKKEEEMRNSIEVGNEIITIGGIFGRIVAVKEDSFVIETGPERAKLRISKWSIQENLTAKASAETKETIKPKKEKKKKSKIEGEE